MARATVLASLLVMAATLRGQVFVVDAANGPGAHFTSIAAAVAAVPDGSTVLVRSGQYSSFAVVGKGLTILGLDSPGSRPIIGNSGTISSIGVSSTAATQSVTIRNLGGVGCSLSLYNCAGPLTVHRVGLVSTTNPFGGTEAGRIDALSCTQLLLDQVNANNQSTIDSCTATMRRCILSGDYGRVVGGLPVFSTVALVVRNSALEMTACGASGGSGNGSGIAPSPGISMTGSALRILDGYVAGGGVFFSVIATTAIVGTGSLRLDPATVLSSGNDPPVSISPPPVVAAMPSLTTGDVGRGGSATATVTDPVGDVAVVLLGLPGPPVAVPGIADPFWLDPAANFFAAIGTAPLTATQPVPNANYLLGFRVVWQAVTWDGASALQASNPGVTVIL